MSLVGLSPPTSARGDTVTLKNGDRLTGTVQSVEAGSMKFRSAVLGELTIDMANIESFTTDPAGATAGTARADVSPATAPATMTSEPGQAVSGDRSTMPRWTGSVLFNGALARGNTDTFDIGFRADAALRRELPAVDDRTTLVAAYNFGTTGRGDDSRTSTDNWNASAKYDRFFNERLYGYVKAGIEHDRVAALNYRLSPGVGLGYQWAESPEFNLNSETGVSYVYEDYTTGGHQEFIALRVAYHVDHKVGEHSSVFHNLEWLPAFDDPADYNLNVDAGIRTDITKSLIAEFRIEFRRDSEPAPGALQNDVRYVLGVGWKF